MLRVLTAAVAAVALSASAFGQVSPTNLTATVTTGDDTSVDLSWSGGSGDGYYVYRLNPVTIQQAVGNTTSAGTADGSVSWTGSANVFDGEYDTDERTQGGPGYSAADWHQVNLTSTKKVGIVGYVPTGQPNHANWASENAVLDVNGSNVNTTTNIYGFPGRSVYRPLYAGTPLDVNNLRVTLTGGVTDPARASTEVDLWEFERIATINSSGTTTYTDTGRTSGQISTYFVSSFQGSNEGTLNVPTNTLGAANVAAIRAGDRDAGGTRSNVFSSNVTRGAVSALPSRAAVPNAASGIVDGPGPIVTWNASSTESTATSDVKRYIVFRGNGAAAPQQIQTQALPSNGGNGVVTKSYMFGTTNNAIDGNTNGDTGGALLAYSNYTETDFKVDFGSGRYFAMTKVAVWQANDSGSAQQHAYRSGYLETSGGYITDPNTGTDQPDAIDFQSINSYTTTQYNLANNTGFATFGFTPKVGGNLPDTWAVGDALTFHLSQGENNARSAEFQIWGIPLEMVGSVLADGSSSYSLADLLGGEGSFDYFVIAEDFAGNQSLALFGNLEIPEPATLSLFGIGALLALRRRR